MSIDKEKLKTLFSGRRSAGGLYAFAENFYSDLPFDVFYVHNVGDVTLPIQSKVYDQIKDCYNILPMAEESVGSTPHIVDQKYLDPSYCAGFTTKTFSKLAKLYLQRMLEITLDNIVVGLEANIDSLVLLENSLTYTKVFNSESKAGSFGYMVLKLPIEEDAGQTNIRITYKEEIKEYKLDNHPSIFMVSAPYQKDDWQEFQLEQSENSRAAFLVFNLIWKNAHELKQYLKPSELPTFLKETWEISEVLSAWRPFTQVELTSVGTGQEQQPPDVPSFLCIPLSRGYFLNRFNQSTLQGIDLLHATRLMALDYLQVHLAIVSEQEKRVMESTVDGQVTKSEKSFYRVKWISSLATWQSRPLEVWTDRHLIDEPSAKMYSLKGPGKKSSPLCPVQHPVLLIRPKWTSVPGKINFTDGLADLENRLPSALKKLSCNGILSDEDRFISDFKLLVSCVNHENNEAIAPSKLLKLLTIANKLHRSDDGLQILKLLASRKYSADDQLEQIEPISDLIVSIGWEKCSAAILEWVDKNEAYFSFVSLARHLFFSRLHSAMMQLTKKIIEKLADDEGDCSLEIEEMIEFYLLLRRKLFVWSEKVYQLLLPALKKSQLQHLWNGLKSLKGKLKTEPDLKRFSEILADLGELVASANLSLISGKGFLDILKEYETVNGGNTVIDRLWNAAIQESGTPEEEQGRASVIQRLIIFLDTDEERAEIVTKLSSYPGASTALNEAVHRFSSQYDDELWKKYPAIFTQYFHFIVLAEGSARLRCPERIESMKYWISQLKGALLSTIQRLLSEIITENGLLSPVQTELISWLLHCLVDYLPDLTLEKDIEFEEVLQCLLWFGDYRLIDMFIRKLKELRKSEFSDLDKVMKSLFELDGLCGEPLNQYDSAPKVANLTLERTHILALLSIWLDFLFDKKMNNRSKIKDSYHPIFRAYYNVEKFQPGEKNHEVPTKIALCSYHVDSNQLMSSIVEVMEFELKASSSDISDACSSLFSSLCRRLSSLLKFQEVIDGAMRDGSLLSLIQFFLRFSKADPLTKMTEAVSRSSYYDAKRAIFEVLKSDVAQNYAGTRRSGIEAFIVLVDNCNKRYNEYFINSQTWAIQNATIPGVPTTFSRQVQKFLQEDVESGLLGGHRNWAYADSLGKQIVNQNPDWALKYEVVPGKCDKGRPLVQCRVTKTRKFDSERAAELRKEVLPVLEDLKKKMEALLKCVPPPAKKLKSS